MQLLPAPCMAVAVLACALAAQAVDAAEPPVFFNSVPGAPRQSDDNQPGTFVFNGQDASRTQFPFQAAMYINLNTFCGGSLIHPRWVLTAAHCAEGSIWYVLVGVTESLTPKQAGRETFITRGAYQHEEFDSRTIVNDIGLIQLMRDVSVGGQYIKLIKPTPPNRSYVGQVGTLSGFGRTDDSTAAAVSPTLKFTTLPVVNNQLCIDRYGEESGGHVSVLCLAAEGTSSCKGDSGGPFTVNDENGNLIQIGLVSYGYKQGCTLGWPVGYTNISHFIDWVSKTTAIDFSS